MLTQACFLAQFLYPVSPDVTKSTQNRAGVEGRVSISSISMEGGIGRGVKNRRKVQTRALGKEEGPF